VIRSQGVGLYLYLNSPSIYVVRLVAHTNLLHTVSFPNPVTCLPYTASASCHYRKGRSPGCWALLTSYQLLWLSFVVGAENVSGVGECLCHFHCVDKMKLSHSKTLVPAGFGLLTMKIISVFTVSNTITTNVFFYRLFTVDWKCES